jgi:hypothetical protein
MAGKIELKAPLDGVVTIEPEDTASNFTVTIPAVTSTLVNEDSDIEAQVKAATNATGDAPIYSCRAWVNFNGTGTVAIRASGNVSSITDNGVGIYTVNFTNALPDANYSVSGTTSDNSTNGNRGTNGIMTSNAFPPASGNCQIRSAYGATASTDGLYHDVDQCYVAIFR